MANYKSILFLKKSFSLLTRHDKRFFSVIFLFSLIISVIETVGIAAIMPFVSVASDFNQIHSNQYYIYLFNIFQFENDLDFVVTFGILLIGFYLFRSLLNFYYYYLLSKFSHGRYYILSVRLLHNYLSRSYGNFTKYNSSNLNKTIINEAYNLTSMFYSLLIILTEVLVVICIYSFMLYMNWKVTLLLTGILAFSAIGLVSTVSKKIKNEGTIKESTQRDFYEVLNSTFNNFKLIKLNGRETQMLNSFRRASSKYALSNIVNGALSQFPRLFLEALGFIILIIIVIFLLLSYKTDISSNISVVTMFILGLYRLMPSANRILTGINHLLFNYRALDIIHDDITYEVEETGEEVISFNSTIDIRDIEFHYEEGKSVLKNVSFQISKGDKVGLIGESGSGKSTLVDIIMGLYKPTSGVIQIDNIILKNKYVKNWRKQIGYIPQHIYLFDGSVAENVAFEKEFNKEQVKKVLEMANILEFLEKKLDGINTQVGENGIKLSGGQKQRIAIARALYNDPDILVLDEATSALDTDTEEIIMEEIYKIAENKTLIIIAHRLSTLKSCNYIYKLDNGELKNV